VNNENFIVSQLLLRQHSGLLVAYRIILG